MNKPSKSKAGTFAVVDNFGESNVVARYSTLDHALQASASISNRTGHRVTIIKRGKVIWNFGGRE